jgi:hypothetical protein
MGEVCLAEGMFEEARQIFERLLKAQIDDAPYWDLLNRARAGLGLEPEVPEAPAVQPAIPEPERPKPAPQPPVPADLAPPPLAGPLSLPGLEPEAPKPAPSPELPPAAPLPEAPPAPVAPGLPPLKVVSAPPPLPAPLPPPPPSSPWTLPSRIIVRQPAVPDTAPLEAAAAIPILRTAYAVHLGELPPAVDSGVDHADELIE